MEVEMHRLFNHPNILSLTGHAFTERGGKCEAWLLLPYISVCHLHLKACSSDPEISKCIKNKNILSLNSHYLTKCTNGIMLIIKNKASVSS